MPELSLFELVNNYRFTATVVLVGLIVAISKLLSRRIRRSREFLTSEERSRLSSIHYFTIALVLTTLLVLWLPQLQHLLISITAIALAIVIATKELSLCLLGALLRKTSNAFKIGDWISVGERFGEVIESNFLTTTMHEIESRTYTYTGRTAVVPNSLFLSRTVLNQNFLRRYQFHSFSITIDPVAFPMDADDRLLKRIDKLIEPFIETAERYNAMLEKRTGIDIPDAKPSIEYSTNDTARIVTKITMFCPTESIVDLEKSVYREFFAWYQNNRHSITVDSKE